MTPGEVDIVLQYLSSIEKLLTRMVALLEEEEEDE